MGRQIIKQPNGKYCIFSSVVDNVTHYHMTEEEIVETWVEEQKKKIEKEVKEIISKLEANEKPYYQFALTYDEMMKTIADIHGDDEVKEIKGLIEN